MSEKKNDRIDIGDAKLKNTTKICKQGNSSGWLVKLSLLVSLVGVSLSGYLLLQFSLQTKNNSIIKMQLEKFILNQNQQKHFVKNIGAQINVQKDNIKSIQTQLSILRSQINTPAKDIYMQISITNIQAAIDYLVLAKDVMLFGGGKARANELVSLAFNKLEASGIANISASDRQNIRKTIDNYISKEDAVKTFAHIQEQFGGLTYITPENSDQIKPKTSNDYLNFLNSIFEIQDIPINQKLVATNSSKLAIADNIYNALISLQSAMYVNNQTIIEKSKANLLKILRQYFIQNQQAQNIEETITSVNAQNTQRLKTSLDKIINDLAMQQNKILSNIFNATKFVNKPESQQ